MKILLGILLLLGAGLALAQSDPRIYAPVSVPSISSPSELTDAFRLLVGRWITAIKAVPPGIFAVLAACDLAWFGIEMWRQKHDFQSAMMASSQKLMAIAFFWFLLLTGPTLFPQLIDLFVGFGRSASGLQSLGPSEILGTGF